MAHDTGSKQDHTQVGNINKEPASSSFLGFSIRLLRRFQTFIYWAWRRAVELFKFLPIRFKLSLIIGSIVVLVVFVFGIIVLQSQKIALMQRMAQVCNVLVQNLSESAKGDLLLGKNDKVIEAVYRLKRTKIEGLKNVAVLNHKGEIIAAFEKEDIENPAEFLKIKDFTIVEKDRFFEYYYPITTQLHENNTTKNILLGIAFVSFSKKAILDPIHNARDKAIWSALIIAFLAIVGINLLAKKMAFQIQLLSEGARQVGKGNLDVTISVSSKDELGQLAKEFNNMTQHLREKLQMQKFVSKLTVQMIKDTVRTNGKNFKGVKKNVTVLFSDVRSFSAIAERLDPEEIVKVINIYFDLQTQIIERHNGIVDKFMGDQIMAIFQGKNMADNALRASVEIQRQIRTLNQKRNSGNEVTLEMGIGINNGSAIMGNMGSANRMDYTVIGDVVNVAARLCASAKAGQIVTSYEVAKKVNGTYPTSRLKSVSVKGRVKSIDVCEVDYDRDILM